MDSLRAVNFPRLSGGKRKACLTELQTQPRKVRALAGNKELLLSAMKYPKDIDVKHAIYASISAN